jgi:hypothetical protein
LHTIFGRKIVFQSHSWHYIYVGVVFCLFCLFAFFFLSFSVFCFVLSCFFFSTFFFFTFLSFFCFSDFVQLLCAQGLAIIFSHHQVCLLTYTWRCENITASPCDCVYHISHENNFDRAQSFSMFYSISNSRN